MFNLITNFLLFVQSHFSLMCSDRIRDFEERLNNDEFASYADFQQDFEDFRVQFQTSVGRTDESEDYFKKISENIYRKAGETVSTRAAHELEKARRISEQR